MKGVKSTLNEAACGCELLHKDALNVTKEADRLNVDIHKKMYDLMNDIEEAPGVRGTVRIHILSQSCHLLVHVLLSAIFLNIIFFCGLRRSECDFSPMFMFESAAAEPHMEDQKHVHT